MIYKVRPMQHIDIDKVYEIEVMAHRAPWGRGILSDCVTVGYDCRLLEVGDESSLELASYIICRYHDSVCHILNLCVLPKLQQKGLGQMLLQDVLNFPADKRTKCFVLEVRPSNIPALQLYYKLGFQQIGIKPGYYIDGESIEDAIVLEKVIK